MVQGRKITSQGGRTRFRRWAMPLGYAPVLCACVMRLGYALGYSIAPIWGYESRANPLLTKDYLPNHRFRFDQLPGGQFGESPVAREPLATLRDGDLSVGSIASKEKCLGEVGI